jgi:hypothetical protein
MPERNVPQIFPCPYPVPCDTFACVKPSRWFIGRPDGPLSLCLKVCEDCARVIVPNLPEELMPPEDRAPANTQDHGQPPTDLVCPKCGKTFKGRAGYASHLKHCSGGEG